MTNTSALTKMTKAQLVAMVQELEETNARLEELVNHFTEESLANRESCDDYGYPIDESCFDDELAPQTIKAPEFDYKQYIDFKLVPQMRHLDYTPMQTKLAATIECHYKAHFDITDKTTRGQLSDRLHSALVAIRDGKLTRRDDADIIARINATFPKGGK